MCWIAALAAAAVLAEPRLPALIGDHMVLQQGVPARIWGKANPGEAIDVTLGSNAPRSAVAGPDGAWQVMLGPLRSGGPFTMTVHGSRTVVVRDVMVGEVWVLSGQSNMTFPLSRSSTAATAIPAADHPDIRLYTVPQRSTEAPLEDAGASWQICTPESARGFSAVGYFFGEELHRRLGVPIGLIHSAWSGSRAEQWTPLDLLESSPELAPMAHPARGALGSPDFRLEFDDFELLRAPDGHDAVPLLNFDDGACPLCSFSWRSGAADGFSLTAPGYGGAGYAARIEGRADPSRPTVFKYRYREDSSPIDLSMYTGIRFRYRGEGHFRFSSLQPTITDADDYGGPSFRGTAEWRTAVIQFASLKQAGWGRQLPFTPFALTAFQVQIETGIDEMVPAGLFNGMVVPLERFTIRGAAWYQGEGNSGRAWQYRTLLPAVIRGWRRAWGQGDFPFLLVQLPNYGRASAEPSESSWAELREAQLLISKTVPNCPLTVTIDLGEADNVHPALKAPVGYRLALRALASVYGQEIVASGPLYDGMRVESGAIRIRFRQIGGLAARGGGQLKGFAIAGADHKFVWADAAIEGDSVLVRSAAVPDPVAVRYAWAADPDCNLVNHEGLPASPFRTDDWPGITAGRQ
jgi:sialate O-acetylesterase